MRDRIPKTRFTLTPFKRGKSVSAKDWYFLYSGINKSANKSALVLKFKQTYPEVNIKNIFVMRNYDRVIVRFVCDKENTHLN